MNEQIKAKLQKSAAFIWEVTKVVAISLAIIIPVRYFLVQPFYVRGASMEPNFHNYEYLIIDQVSYRFHDPVRGDVVVLRNPQQPKQFFIKRVIGMPGETVEIRDRAVFINSERLDESVYLDSVIETWGNQTVQLEDGEYFLLGDNRNESLDSRVFGPVTRDEIVGRTWLRTWPLNTLDHFEEIQYSIDSPLNDNE